MWFYLLPCFETERSRLKATAVLHSPPADLVFWADDDKQENEPDVLEK